MTLKSATMPQDDTILASHGTKKQTIKATPPKMIPSKAVKLPKGSTGKAKQGLTLREYGNRRNVNEQRISQLKAAGKLVFYADGSINPEASDDKIEAARNAAKGPGGSPRLSEIKIEREKVALQRDILKLEKEKGTLVEYARIEPVLAQMFTSVKQSLLGLPRRVAPMLVMQQQQYIQDRLYHEIEEALRGLVAKIDLNNDDKEG